MRTSSSWPRLVAWLMAMTGAIVLAAPRGAGPGTATCRAALDALQRLETEAITARDAAPAGGAAVPQRTLEQVRALRRDAAKACLGGSGDAPPPTASMHPPATLAPARPGDAPPRPPVTTSVPTVMIPRPSPPVTITSCDPNGCWASDGSRLSRFGATTLLGPRGVCTVQGSLLNCP